MSKPKVKLGWKKEWNDCQSLCYFNVDIKRWCQIGKVVKLPNSKMFSGILYDGHSFEIHTKEDALELKEAKRLLIEQCGFKPDGEVKRIR